jgi:integrase
MSAPLRALLAAQPRRDGRDQVFGDAAVQGFTRWNASKVELDKRLAELHGEPMPGWTLHDLRRSFSTTLHDKFGVAPHVVEVLLGHVGHQAGVAGIYNRSTYLPECARALDRWADHLTAIVTGEPATAQIVSLRRSLG